MPNIALSRIDLRVLSVFLDVVEHEGFSAAAIANDASLSSVTRDVAALETRLGMRLCLRGRGGFGLTSHGKEIYSAAKQLMQEVRGFEARAAATRDTMPDALEIGLIDNMIGNPDCLVTATLAELHRKMPDLIVRVSVHSESVIEVLVRERRLDIGFTGKPDFLTPLLYVPAFVEEHRLYVSQDCPQYPAIKAWQPGGDDTQSLPYVARSFQSEQFAEFEAATPLRITAVGTSLEGVLACILACFGCGILPIHAARGFTRLVTLPFPTGSLNVPFSMVMRQDAKQDRAVATFLKLYNSNAVAAGLAQA